MKTLDISSANDDYQVRLWGPGEKEDVGDPADWIVEFHRVRQKDPSLATCYLQATYYLKNLMARHGDGTTPLALHTYGPTIEADAMNVVIAWARHESQGTPVPTPLSPPVRLVVERRLLWNLELPNAEQAMREAQSEFLGEADEEIARRFRIYGDDDRLIYDSEA